MKWKNFMQELPKDEDAILICCDPIFKSEFGYLLKESIISMARFLVATKVRGDLLISSPKSSRDPFWVTTELLKVDLASLPDNACWSRIGD